MVPYNSLPPRIYYCAPRAEGDLADDGLPICIMNPDDPKLRHYDTIFLEWLVRQLLERVGGGTEDGRLALIQR